MREGERERKREREGGGKNVLFIDKFHRHNQSDKRQWIWDVLSGAGPCGNVVWSSLGHKRGRLVGKMWSLKLSFEAKKLPCRHPDVMIGLVQGELVDCNLLDRED